MHLTSLLQTPKPHLPVENVKIHNYVVGRPYWKMGSRRRLFECVRGSGRAACVQVCVEKR